MILANTKKKSKKSPCNIWRNEHEDSQSVETSQSDVFSNIRTIFRQSYASDQTLLYYVGGSGALPGTARGGNQARGRESQFSRELSSDYLTYRYNQNLRYIWQLYHTQKRTSLSESSLNTILRTNERGWWVLIRKQQGLRFGFEYRALLLRSTELSGT